jgi:hypothetical protein
MDSHTASLRDLWNRFFFKEAFQPCCGIFRIAYATLLLINVLVWWPDLNQWFGESGVLDFASSRTVIDADTITLFAWLPKTGVVLWGAYFLLIGHLLLLLVGFYTRVQAFGVFIWFTSFQHRNLLIFDGEDYLFRLFAFLLILLPAGKYFALDSRRESDRAVYPIWPLRLAQLQLTVVYISTAWEKLRGSDWVDGLAVYYASRLDGIFGRFPLPGVLLESLFLMKLLTWLVLVLECFIPLGLWFKETRRWAIVSACFLHLSLEYTMNLFLFQWLMLASLILFLDRPPWRKGALMSKSLN